MPQSWGRIWTVPALLYLSIPLAYSEGQVPNTNIDLNPDIAQASDIGGIADEILLPGGNYTANRARQRDLLRSYSASNNANISQIGANNTAVIEQSGEDNSANLLQIGAYNSLHFTQVGDSNHSWAMQVGSDNTANLAQFGDANNLDLIQTGSGLNISITQHGDNSSAYVLQY